MNQGGDGNGQNRIGREEVRLEEDIGSERGGDE
jgi:hypothetical protein